MQMNTVKITLQEYKRLILAERNLNALVDAIVDNTKIYVSSYPWEKRKFLTTSLWMMMMNFSRF